MSKCGQGSEILGLCKPEEQEDDACKRIEKEFVKEIKGGKTLFTTADIISIFDRAKHSIKDVV